MRLLKIYWRTLLILTTILFLSLLNIGNMIPREIHFHRHFDKFVHFMMYFTLSFVFFIENYKNENSIRKIWVIFDTITIGIAIEFLQFLVTNYRSGNFYDAIFNTLGVIVGSVLFILLKDFPFIYKIMLYKESYKR